jgi:hypothetical protein
MPRSRKKTAFVPSVVFGTVVLGVVPACALSCGGTTGPADASADAPRDGFSVADVGFPGVAAVGFCAFCDSGPGDDAADAGTDGPPLGVAAVGFCAFCDAGDASEG